MPGEEQRLPPSDLTGDIRLPALWQARRTDRPRDAQDAALHLDAVAGAAILRLDGRELRFTMSGGDLISLLHAALAIHADVPAMAWPVGETLHGSTKAAEPTLDPRASPAAAAAVIIEAGLHHLLANLRTALAGHVEAFHQLRIATRRLRAALALFTPYLDRDETAALQAQLRDLGRVLGTARDWDVFCLETLPGLPDTSIAADWRTSS